MFKSLSDDNRIKILEIIKKEKKINACNLLKEFNITQPTLSYHMNILVESGLVKSKREKNCSIYEINENTINKLKDFFNQEVK
jgi:ArsR family transcriptional regulator